jgi:hypothetical protein
MIQAIVTRINKKSSHSDFSFWQSQSFEKRLETLEMLRQEYNSWKYADQSGFQRVFTIIKRRR